MALGSRTLLNLVDRAIRELRHEHPEIPSAFNRKTVAHVGREDEAKVDKGREIPEMDRSIELIRKRGVLRVGIHPGVEGLCAVPLRPSTARSARAQDDMAQGDKGKHYEGLEPEIARRVARLIFGDPDSVEFVPLEGVKRISATRSSWLHALFALRKSLAIFTTLLGTNWWNLGMAGKLPDFLCPRECVGTLDYVGLDYYWGAADFQYSSAPVWPDALGMILLAAAKAFPGKPIMVIENGCVTRATGVGRPDYLTEHVNQVRKAIAKGAPVDTYICWSITSNREWGLQFDDGSDFGLYHIDLDGDPELKRIPTDSSSTYARLIAGTMK
jgi:hypothetical protein